MPGPEVLSTLRLVRPVWHLRVAEPDNLFLTAFACLDFPALFLAGSLSRLVARHSVFHAFYAHLAFSLAYPWSCYRLLPRPLETGLSLRP